MDKNAAIIMTQTKSVAAAVLLPLFFGGLGVFYSSAMGGVVMTIVTLVVWGIAFVTFGLGTILIPIVHLVAVAWSVAATNGYNQRLISSLTSGSEQNVHSANTANVKKCPKCAELVKREAVVCKHCGADFVNQNEPILVDRNVCPKCSKDFSKYITTCGDCNVDLVPCNT